MKHFADFFNALDGALASAVALVVPAAALLLVAWLREQLLRAKARAAALEAELQGNDDDAAAVSIEMPVGLATSSKRMKKLVEAERPRARKMSKVYRDSYKPE